MLAIFLWPTFDSRIKVSPVAKKAVHRYANRRPGSKEVPAAEFKDSCLRLVDRVHQTREEIVVTKYGRPVAKLVAFEEGPAPLFGHLAGSVTIQGDIVAPVKVEWDAEA
jgi:prevent-host-death family protein